MALQRYILFSKHAWHNTQVETFWKDFVLGIPYHSHKYSTVFLPIEFNYWKVIYRTKSISKPVILRQQLLIIEYAIHLYFVGWLILDHKGGFMGIKNEVLEIVLFCYFNYCA